jgi:hypothetical protein
VRRGERQIEFSCRAKILFDRTHPTHKIYLSKYSFKRGNDHVLITYTLISALLRVEVQKRKFFVKTSTIRGISPPGRAGGRGKSKNKGRAGDEASNFLDV